MLQYLQSFDGPVIEGMEDKESVYGANQPEYFPIRVLATDAELGNAVISRWTLTEEQRKLVANGADIFLELLTFGQPLQPIRIAVSDNRNVEDWKQDAINSSPLPAPPNPSRPHPTIDSNSLGR